MKREVLVLESNNTLKKSSYKTGEVADMVGLSIKTITKYCDNNVIEGVVNGKTYRIIPRESVIKFLRSKGMFLETNENMKDILYYTELCEESGTTEFQNILNTIITKSPKNLEILNNKFEKNNVESQNILDKLIDDILDDNVDRIFISKTDNESKEKFRVLKVVLEKHNVEIVEI